MSEFILETRDLAKNFGGLAANQGISLRVPARTFYTVIGPNGAGKTTLFNLISGAHRPTSGQVFFRGEDITGLPPHLIARRGVGRSFQITNLFPNLKVLENVRLAAQARGREGHKLWLHADSLHGYREAAERVLEEVGLAAKRHLPASGLSHGDKRKLEIGVALAAQPILLLLDEPTAGMSHEEVPSIIDLLRRLKERGQITILMVEHKMDIVMSISDRVAVLAGGRVIAEGTPAEISANPAVQAAYLGGAAAEPRPASPAAGQED